MTMERPQGKCFDDNDCETTDLRRPHSPGFHMNSLKYKCWIGSVITCLLLGFVLMVMNTAAGVLCLLAESRSTVSCRILLMTKTTKIGVPTVAIVSTAEPILSLTIVGLILLFTLNPSLEKPKKAKQFARRIWKKLRMLCRKYWFLKYITLILISFVYHLIVFIREVQMTPALVLRYITLPLGLSVWFIWLVLLNENGSIILVVKQQRACARKRFTSLSRLHNVLLVFAALTNFVEFVFFTIYMAASIVVIGDESKIVWFIDLVGMSITSGLRYGFASFFSRMLFVGERKYSLLSDPWEEGGDSGDKASLNDMDTSSSKV
ncbi:uncharacterized protein [Ptychodera flava]|uniref:uncharacterized protein n=1 Tax=Ptychodera flava TaxID=63121 RepID=UPI00396A2240